MSDLDADGPARAPHAFVTLVTNADFARGAAALLRSLRLAGTEADLVVLHSGQADLSALDGLGARLVRAAPLPVSAGFRERHERGRLHAAAPFEKGRKPVFHTPLDNFLKLRAWQLDYARAVFLDADTLVLRPIDRLFAYPDFAAAPNVYESLADFHRLNSGVFTVTPDPATFGAMLAALDAPGAFWRRTDQTFLQTFFPDWHGLPVTMNMLQYVWFNLPGLWHWPSVRVVHYQYEKPWEDPHPKRDRLGPLIDLWHEIDAGRRPDLAALRDPGPPARR